MAIAVDASTPARWATSSASGVASTSSSFTAPANALLVLCANLDADTSSCGTVTPAVADSGGLTWTQRVRRATNETTDGGETVIYTARTTSSTSRTVDWNPSWTVNTGTAHQKSAKLYVLTGVDVDGTPVDTVGANNEGGSGTNNLTTSSITPGANGLLVACDTDWNALGTMTSSDLTMDTAHYAGLMSVSSGYKTTTSGVGATANLNAGGSASAQHKWTQVTVRESTAAQDTPELRGRPGGLCGERQMQQALAQ